MGSNRQHKKLREGPAQEQPLVVPPLARRFGRTVLRGGPTATSVPYSTRRSRRRRSSRTSFSSRAATCSALRVCGRVGRRRSAASWRPAS